LNLNNFLENFIFTKSNDLFAEEHKTIVKLIEINNKIYKKYINSFWTEKQRQSNNLHEISYRACFKSELPNFFISLLTKEKDTVFDPFSGRGTTVLESALMNRNIVANDINPLLQILVEPRLNPPTLAEIENRLNEIEFKENLISDLDLSMFYHKDTLNELLNYREILIDSKVDKWIRMVATNRLTGHSSGFFSVYTLPPNQAVTAERQIKLNEKNGNQPEYRDTKKLILKKSKQLLKNIYDFEREKLENIYENAKLLNLDSTNLSEIESNSINLTVTSPPFLDVIDYNTDNWLRNWFNKIETPNISNFKKLEDWENFIYSVMKEIYRITKPNGYFVFEVGEVKNGKINLEEVSIPLGEKAGFICEAILINEQNFTKTANIWKVENNSKGTNSNRILIFKKEKE
jgi:DNA modification methylase